MRFHLPGDDTRYEHVCPVCIAAWNKMVAVAQQHPATLWLWKDRKPRQSFAFKEVFVPVKAVLLGRSVTEHKCVSEL